MRPTFFQAATVYFIVMALAWTGSLRAQSEEQIRQFQKQREAYFTEHLELTDEEAKVFWPVFEDFHNRKMKLLEEERFNYQYVHSNFEHLTDDEALEILTKVANLKREKLELEEEFYNHKFLEVLPAKKVLKLGKVEWDYRRYLVRKLRGSGHGERPGHGPGGGPGGGPGDGPW